MKPIPFTYHKKVSAADLDDLAHVNNIRFIEWLLEIAERHWNTKTPAAVRSAYGWVVLEHHIYYKRPAKLNEQLTLITWIDSYKGVKSTRKTKIINATEQVILEAETLWCFIDLQNQKPARITPEIVHPYFEFNER